MRDGPGLIDRLPGPGGPIPCARDELGYPRIRARDFAEGTWARGYLHATDRLLQVQLALIAAEGRLMEYLGDRPLHRQIDRSVRHLDLGRRVDEQAAALSPTAREMVEAYCDGFNRGIDARRWPWLLRLLGRERRRYRPTDLVRLYRLFCYLGLTSSQHLAVQTIAEWVAAGAPREAFDLLLGDSARGIDLGRLSGLHVEAESPGLPLSRGSNAFAMAGSRSSSGGALLMSEFHMEINRTPPLLYACHVDYIQGGSYGGLGMPGLAWLSAARTEHVGWSYTYGHGDNVDVLVERCRDGRYLVQGEWRPLVERVEKVRIRGRRTESWTFWDNEYGSIDADARAGGDLPCFRWTGMHDGTAPDIHAARVTAEARNTDEWIDLHRPLASISLTGVVADSRGQVAKILLGRVDRRLGGRVGVCPRPGWDLPDRNPLPVDESERPVVIRPADGIAVSANEQMDPAWVTLPEPHYRYERLREGLDGLRDAHLRDLVRLSYDTHDRCMERLLPIWQPLLPDPGRVIDGSLFHALHHELAVTLLERHVGEKARVAFEERGLLFKFQFHMDSVLALERTQLLDRQALGRAIAVAWPRAVSRVRRGHTLPPKTRFAGPIAQSKLGHLLSLGGPARTLRGSPTSPFQARRLDVFGHTVVAGPAFHLLFDLSGPGAWYHVPGGASEQRSGPGYGKGVELWLDGRFLPLGDPLGDPPDLEGTDVTHPLCGKLGGRGHDGRARA